MGNPISIDYTMPAMILSFLLLVWLLGKYAWKPLMGIMEERRDFIRNNLREAQEQRKQAELIKQEYQEEMERARKEAREITARAAKAGEDQIQEVLLKARKEAENQKSAARADIQRERDRALAEVRAQIGDLSVAIAEKIILRKIDFSTQEHLVEQFIKEVGEMR